MKRNQMRSKSTYSRMERRRRRQWIAVYLILAAAVLALAGAIVWAQPFKKEPLVREPNEPMYEVFTKSAENAVDHPPAPKRPQYDVPLDNYLQEVLWKACMEWKVPYKLALAVCWRETQYRNLVTELPSGTYYGMMAVDIEDAGYYMELCGVDNLDTEENRLRVGCCILGQHLKNEGSVAAALARYSADDSGGYAADVLRYMEELE